MTKPDEAKPIHQITAQTIDEYLRHEAEGGASANALRRHRGSMNALYSYLPADKGLTEERLLEWRRAMEEKGYAPITIQNYVKSINRYLDYFDCSALRFCRGRAKDLSGKTFGYLRPIHPTDKRDRGDIIWLCQCRCGNMVELPATRLLRGNTLSCGCLQKQHRKDGLKKANKCFAGTNLNQSMQERIFSKHNKSGYVGVYQKRDKWMAILKYRSKTYYLGAYYSVEEAAKARARAKELAMEDARELLELYDRLHQDQSSSKGEGIISFLPEKVQK